jgi:dolichyl-phosphate beta-glucosyltransferase
VNPVLSLVIPALDEAQRLPGSLKGVASYLAGQRELCPTEIIVVDDGSGDETAAVAEAMILPPDLRMIVRRHAVNRGKGAAVRTGFAASNGRWLLLCDADLAAPIEEVGKLLEVADQRTVAVGSRAVDRRLITVRQPLYRDIMGRCFNLFQQILVLPGIRDTQCGFKLFPGTLGRALARVQRLDGFAYDVELLLLARRWGYRLAEVGIHWRHVEASRVQAIRHSAQMFRDLLRLSALRLSRSLPPPPEDLHFQRDSGTP